jgi:predicted anti-sigma-YlaC factor YlaD
MNCPDLETLLLGHAEGSGEFTEHVAACPSCAAMLEEHRQLEKDLFRLVDPLPPSDLVALVMRRVAAEPLPVRAEMRVGLSILAATLMAAVLSFVATHGPIGLLGASAARAMVSWKTTFLGLNNAVQVTWSTTTVPLAVCLSFVLFLSLVGLRRVAPARTVEIEVLP